MRLRNWLLAIVGKAPMGTTEALVLVAAGAVGIVSIYAVLLKPEDPDVIRAIWIIGMIASAALLVRGLFELLLPVLRVLNDFRRGFLDALPIQFRSPVVRRPRESSDDEPGELGFLDFEARADAAMRESSRTLNAIANEIQALGKTVRRFSPRFANAAGMSPKSKLSLGRDSGSKMDAHARRLEVLQAAYRPQVEEMASNYLERLRSAPAASLMGVRDSISRLRDAAAEARPSAVEIREAVQLVRRQSVQQLINRATDRLDTVQGRLISDIDSVTRFTTDALRVIDDKIAAANIEAANAALAAEQVSDAAADPGEEVGS